MYIIKTTIGEQIKIDYDELVKLDVSPDTLIFFRRGAVLRKIVGIIVEDEEMKATMKRKPGESEGEALKRLKENKSEDIFQSLRKNGLPPGTPKLL